MTTCMNCLQAILNKDAKIYMKQNSKDAGTLKGIFLKEKITSNTVIKKIRDIILLFDQKYHESLLSEFENRLGHKIDVLENENAKKGKGETEENNEINPEKQSKEENQENIKPENGEISKEDT